MWYQIKNKTNMKEYIEKLKEQLSEYLKLVADYESNGLENLDYEETETYGVYLGKSEILEEIINKLETF